MQSSHILIIMIVLIVTIGSIVRAKLGIRRERHGRGSAIQDDAETKRLREEVIQMRDRLAVLERITVEKENSLAREIEQLRDR